MALGGIAAEYVTFGQANGGMSDIIQLEALFEALKFDQQQTNVLLRTSVMPPARERARGEVRLGHEHGGPPEGEAGRTRCLSGGHVTR